MARILSGEKEIQELVDEYEKQVLPVHVIAYHVIKCVVENEESEYLKLVPEEVRAAVEEVISLYQTEGRVCYVSNQGEVDRTDLVRKLVNVLSR